MGQVSEWPWRSKKWTAYVATLIALVALTLIGGASEAVTRLGDAIMFGLPLLLGGQAAVDYARQRTSAGAPPPAGASER